MTVDLHKDLAYQKEIIVKVPSSRHTFELIVSNGEPDVVFSLEFDTKSAETSGHRETVKNSFKTYKFDKNGKVTISFDDLWCSAKEHVGAWMKLRFKYYTKTYYITFKYRD